MISQHPSRYINILRTQVLYTMTLFTMMVTKLIVNGASFYLFCLTLLCKVNEFQLTILYLVLQRKSMFDSVLNNHCFILLSKCYSKELNVARWQYCQRGRSQRRMAKRRSGHKEEGRWSQID